MVVYPIYPIIYKVYFVHPRWSRISSMNSMSVSLWKIGICNKDPLLSYQELFRRPRHHWKLTRNLDITQLKRNIIFQNFFIVLNINLSGCSQLKFNEHFIQRNPHMQQYRWIFLLRIFSSLKKNPTVLFGIKFCIYLGAKWRIWQMIHISSVCMWTHVWLDFIQLHRTIIELHRTSVGPPRRDRCLSEFELFLRSRCLSIASRCEDSWSDRTVEPHVPESCVAYFW